jgi:hypothetical protein
LETISEELFHLAFDIALNNQKFRKSANVSKNCVQTLTELAGVFLFVTDL